MNRIEHHLLNMYVITTYLLQLRKHILNARSTFVWKLDEIIVGTWITYHFYKTPRNVLELGRLINFPFGSLREELF